MLLNVERVALTSFGFPTAKSMQRDDNSTKWKTTAATGATLFLQFRSKRYLEEIRSRPCPPPVDPIDRTIAWLANAENVAFKIAQRRDK